MVNNEKLLKISDALLPGVTLKSILKVGNRVGKRRLETIKGLGAST